MRYRASSRGVRKGSCSQRNAKGPIFAPRDLRQPPRIPPLLPFAAAQHYGRAATLGLRQVSNELWSRLLAKTSAVTWPDQIHHHRLAL
jgi:hypothetical protein